LVAGESGRTTGHLSHALDGHSEIASKHGGQAKAKFSGESHQWAIEHVGKVAKELGIDCEYRQLPAYQVSQYSRGEEGHDDDVKMLKEQVAMVNSIGLSASFTENHTICGWDGTVDQRDMAIYDKQATFHPTKYMVGIMKHLQTLPNFSCYTHTRMMSCTEHGLHVPILDIGSKSVTVETQHGPKITCKNAVQATCVPLQKLSVIVEMEFLRTYAIAVRVPKGSVEDCLIYDTADPYTYLRITSCDADNDFLIVGGEDHKVGQEGDASGRYAHLEQWTRDRFPQATTVDYKWSGQVFESVDFVAFIGLNQGNKNIYVVTGDCGDGLTHGVLAGKLIADQIQEIDNPWSALYDPKRVMSIAKSAGSMIAHDVQVNTQYKRFLQSDIEDIGELKNGEGGVLNQKTGKPVAVYKDEQGNVRKFSALCPHLKGVVCWNQGEKSWDCPIHGSRFGRDGVQIIGPSLAGLNPLDEDAEREQKAARGL
jgi:glycine/D-amino acid oxidase-like deaminating enzyme